MLEKQCVKTNHCHIIFLFLKDQLKKYRSQKQQDPNVQPATSMNFNGEHHFNVFNSSDLSMNFNELFQGAYLPQLSEFLYITSLSLNDYSLNRWNE
ncbi:hypothetical protein H5410_057801 [Solanum commersonii]|uniref:Uncharacterized protein n=1 Tax=Solanum commersonii TaxID=4109 RepID=A0A9J5WNW0_SOLCO|nr:hypothetical protein H5410_057801 [Solanum commersonii]